MNIRGSFMVACLLTAAGAAQAGIFNTNGYAVQYRIFNGMPTSNLTANGVPLPGVDGMGDPLPFDNFPTNGLGTLAQPFGNMNIRDEYPFPTGNQGFANKMTPFKGQLSDLEYQGINAYFRALAGKATDADNAAPAPAKK